MWLSWATQIEATNCRKPSCKQKCLSNEPNSLRWRVTGGSWYYCFVSFMHSLAHALMQMLRSDSELHGGSCWDSMCVFLNKRFMPHRHLVPVYLHSVYLHMLRSSIPAEHTLADHHLCMPNSLSHFEARRFHQMSPAQEPTTLYNMLIHLHHTSNGWRMKRRHVANCPTFVLKIRFGFIDDAPDSRCSQHCLLFNPFEVII